VRDRRLPSLFICFNEAATNQSRKGRFHANKLTTSLNASMRPRPISRGKRFQEWARPHLVSASMRPRPISRGKPLLFEVQ